MTNLQPLAWDYALPFGDTPTRMPPKASSGRQIIVHWVAEGRVTHTTTEAWADISSIVTECIGEILDRGEIWWSDNGKIHLEPPR